VESRALAHGDNRAAARAGAGRQRRYRTLSCDVVSCLGAVTRALGGGGGGGGGSGACSACNPVHTVTHKATYALAERRHPCRTCSPRRYAQTSYRASTLSFAKTLANPTLQSTALATTPPPSPGAPAARSPASLARLAVAPIALARALLVICAAVGTCFHLTAPGAGGTAAST
jgi:hypothetical protein